MKTLPSLILATAALALAASTNILGAVTPAIVPKLQTVFTNPAPTHVKAFGESLAAIGADRVLIGAWDDQTLGFPAAGAAYLFNTNGALLVTFTNPIPADDDDGFGTSLAAVGTNLVIGGAFLNDTGASNAGAAYLFSTSGTLLTTFSNPTPEADGYFGFPVAAVGLDRVLIGASGHREGAVVAGAVYLFHTNGALLTTFTNPSPRNYDSFGSAAVSVGITCVLVGAPGDDTGAENSGAAYLFTTNGALLNVFTNPSPVDSGNFGRSVATVGADRVLIGAPDITGAAYLFSTNGALLTTFTNPTPTDYDSFGISVASVGSGRVLIGDYTDDIEATDSGAAYLFDASGRLLTVFTNPTPWDTDLFGYRVAAAGNERVLIGAGLDDQFGLEAGIAYLFTLEPPSPPAPSLSISLHPQFSILTVAWPAPSEGWLLEGTNALPSVPTSAWTLVPPPYQTNAGTISVTLTNQPATGNQFFRLRQP